MIMFKCGTGSVYLAEIKRITKNAVCYKQRSIDVNNHCYKYTEQESSEI